MMVSISALDVKNLREKSGAGMMDCKKALVETNGDFTKALELLRIRGVSEARKKLDRVALDGLTAIYIKDRKGVIIEVNSETDFVAKNNHFQDLVKEISILAYNAKSMTDLESFQMSSGLSLKEEIVESIGKIGEKITLRRFDCLEVSDGVIASYVHNKVQEKLGKICVIVALESEIVDKQKLLDFGQKIAAHIAANNPKSLTVEDLDSNFVASERECLLAQTENIGKDTLVIEKIVKGKMRKFFSDVVLLEQKFLYNEKISVKEFLYLAEKELGGVIKIKQFFRYALGENLDY